MKPAPTPKRGKLHHARCVWCGREVKLKQGRIPEHVTPGNIRCVGIGQPTRS